MLLSGNIRESLVPVFVALTKNRLLTACLTHQLIRWLGFPSRFNVHSKQESLYGLELVIIQ